MTNLNRIVAATDLSAPARHASERAAMLAADRDACLTLIHVASQAPLAQLRQLLGTADERVAEALQEGLREAMRELGESVRQRFAVAPALDVSTGDLLPGLLARVDAARADLLVLGARGASFLRHILLGSTAERLLSSARVPVLVVRLPPHERYRCVLVPVDFSPVSLRALRLAAEVAPGAVITAMHVYEVPFEGQLRYAGVDEAKIEHYRSLAAARAQANLAGLLETSGIEPGRLRTVMVNGDVSQRILEYEQELDCELIVVGKHGAGVFEELLLGSTTKHLLAEAQGDVLVVA